VVNWLMCFPRSGPAKDRNKINVTFNNSSVILLQSVIFVEETEVNGEKSLGTPVSSNFKNHTLSSDLNS
jgi:hypothetical protein